MHLIKPDIGGESPSAHSQIYGHNKEEKETHWLCFLYLFWKEFHLRAAAWIQVPHSALYSTSLFNQLFPNKPEHFAGHYLQTKLLTVV